MRELVIAVLCVLPMSAWAWTNIQPQFVNLPPDAVAALLASGRGHGSPRGGGGPAISSGGGGGFTAGSQADPSTRGEPSGVIQLVPVQAPMPQSVQPVQLQMQRVQVLPVAQQWEGGTTIAVPVTIRLGVGQAVTGAPCGQ